ncbi:MAG: HAD family hydrolase [Lachnospiraceae bacterium]
MRKAVIFDVDGTLWDAVPQITRAWNETAHKFPEVTTQLREEQFLSYMGKTMDAYVGLFPELSAKKAQEVLAACCEEENDYLREHPGTLYPGIREVLEQLRQKYELYIVSNCQEGYIEALLSSCGLEEYFEDYECYGRTGQKKGRNIRILMERCGIDKAVYIGDTQMDQEAAMETEIPFVFAAYGMGKTEYSRFVAQTPDEIPEVIASMRYFEL